MIGEPTKVTIGAFLLGSGMARLNLGSDAEQYESVRQVIETGLQDGSVGAVPPPRELTDYEEWSSSALQTIVASLAESRSRLGGDTTALPVFYISFFSFPLCAAMVFGDLDAEQARDFVETALDDLGLGADFLRRLERNVGMLSILPDDTVSTNAVTNAALAFCEDVLTQILERSADSDLRAGVAALTQDVDHLRQEFADSTQSLARLIKDGNAEITEVIGQVTQQLEAHGLLPARAAELTTRDPETLWDRTVRWFGGAGPRNAAEDALWAALDFVPAGTGIKLGIKIAEAVRASIRGSKPSPTPEAG